MHNQKAGLPENSSFGMKISPLIILTHLLRSKALSLSHVASTCGGLHFLFSFTHDSDLNPNFHPIAEFGDLPKIELHSNPMLLEIKLRENTHMQNEVRSTRVPGSSEMSPNEIDANSGRGCMSVLQGHEDKQWEQSKLQLSLPTPVGIDLWPLIWVDRAHLTYT